MSFLKKYVIGDFSLIVLFSIIFLFFIQTLSDLFERIWAFALPKAGPDMNVLGLLVLLLPLSLLAFRKKVPDLALLITGEIIILARLVEPLMAGMWIYIFAGLSVGSFLVFFPGFITRIKNREEKTGFDFGIAMASAVGLSIMFRTAGVSKDISQYGWWQVIGWILGIIASLILITLYLKLQNKETEEAKPMEEETKASFWKVLGLSIGIFSIFITIWFTFMSPTVISRWTEGNYIGIVIGILIMLGAFIGLKLWKPELVNKLKPWMLWVWNGLFAISMTLTVLVHQIFFISSSISYPLVASATAWYQQIPMVLMIILSPILYLDFTLLTKELIKLKPSPTKMGVSFTIGGFFIVFMIFMQILPNIWGHLEPISTPFRDMYWLAFFIPGLVISLSILLVKKTTLTFEKLSKKFSAKIILSSVFGLIFIGTIIGGAVTAPNPNYSASGKTSLVIMTYNILQGINITSDWNFDGQLEIIKAVDPDILGLQECDPTRISGGNLDVVRYFASALNMYSYYGPKTVTNTYGCAILSKYPITNAYSFFAYSDVEQIGSAQAQITVGTTVFNVAVHHPAGRTDQVMRDQNLQMLDQVNGLSNIIYMGDFNYYPYSQMYNDTLSTGLIDSYAQFYGVPAINLSELTGYLPPNSDKYSAIDHIFLSSGTVVSDAQYIEIGHSDHPAYWCEIVI
ncbi:MAG: endonuclease/exonuclease/phosphatase family protein [Candidatus Heimdallarchaeaceae archaeon]|jgi:endonuclease/exonuclease/phosphatase family metal-dependent hydrolase